MFVCLAILLPVVASGVFVQAMSSTDRAIGGAATKAVPVKLPEKLIVGYANWNECKLPICSEICKPLFVSNSPIVFFFYLLQAMKRLWML